MKTKQQLNVLSDEELRLEYDKANKYVELIVCLIQYRKNFGDSDG